MRRLFSLVFGSQLPLVHCVKRRGLVRHGTTQRHGELETFSHMCLDELSRFDSLNQDDYAAFLGEFCRQSPIRGPACPSSGFSFLMLPVDLQILYVDCPSHALFQQIDCLQYQIDRIQQIPYHGRLEILCAQSFSAMKSSLLLVAHNHVSTQSTALSNNVQTRGVGNGLRLTDMWESSKSAKESKEGNKKGTSAGANGSIISPSASPFTSMPSFATTSSYPAPNTIATSSEPTLSPIGSSSFFQDHGKQDQQSTNISPPAIIGSTALGLLLVVCAAWKLSKRQCRRYPNAGGKPENSSVFADEASILSEPSQLLTFEPNTDCSRSDSGQAATKKRWFQNLFRSHLSSLLDKTKSPIYRIRRDADPQTQAKQRGSVSSTSSHCTPSGARDEQEEYPFFAEGPRENANENNERDISREAYHLDIDPIEEKVTSSLSSASLKNNKWPIEALFRKRGSLFSRRDAPQDEPVTDRDEDLAYSREIDSCPELSVRAYPSREIGHENAMLEVQGAADYNNEKPWRKEVLKRRDSVKSYENEAPTIDDIETSFLSPDVAQLFRDVDRRLSDGLREVREEDHKLGLEVDKFQAAMNTRTLDEEMCGTFQKKSCKDMLCSPSSSDSFPADSKSQSNQNNDNNVHGAVDNPFISEYPSKGGMKSVVSENLPTPDISGQNINDDNEEDLICEDERGRSPFAPAWIQQEQSDAWNASRSSLSLPRHSFFDDAQKQHSSLLPPRVDSMDSNNGD